MLIDNDSRVCAIYFALTAHLSDKTTYADVNTIAAFENRSLMGFPQENCMMLL